mmetsp:Transcript_1310/g.2320  ORF Transcript_1310/g.2320 Transcript_1310/m.2320 type:complete len:220 (-) Transcript_1310:893-1552(-)
MDNGDNKFVASRRPVLIVLVASLNNEHGFLVDSAPREDTGSVHQGFCGVRDSKEGKGLEGGCEAVVVEGDSNLNLARREPGAVRRNACNLGLRGVDTLDVHVSLLRCEPNDDIRSVDKVDSCDFDGSVSSDWAELRIYVHNGIGRTNDGADIEHVHVVVPLICPAPKDDKLGSLAVIGESGVSASCGKLPINLGNGPPLGSRVKHHDGVAVGPQRVYFR